MCSLADGIRAANASGEAVVITLGPQSVHTLETVDHRSEGGNGLPAVTGELRIEGQGARVERSPTSDTPVFRLFRVAPEGKLTLRDLTLTHGATERGFDGAAIWNLGELRLDRVVIEDNHSGDDGGGIRNDGVLVIEDSVIRNNSARWRGGVGGGLQNAEQFGPAELKVERSSFIGNEAWASGGGLWLEGTSRLRNTTVSGNRAGERGAGIHNYGELELRNCTVTENRAHVTGGGLFTFGSVVIGNTILSGNEAMISGECKGILQSTGHNLLGKLFECTVAGLSEGNLLNTPPLLESLSGDGAPPGHRPRAESPALGAGSGEPFSSADAACSERDQHGVKRPAGRCDIGAVQRRSAEEAGR